MKKRKLICLSVLLIILAITFISRAEIPHVINFQGKATDGDGVPLNVPHNLTFRIYNVEEGGTALWTETHQDVDIANGIFSVLLGSVDPVANPLDLSFAESYWLGVEVAGDGEMDPRVRLASVAYAYEAKTAERLDTNEVIDAKGGLIIENRTSDPESPETGRIWYRTDL